MKIIAFEGIDGTGKTTLIKSMYDFLHSKEMSVSSVANPAKAKNYPFAQKLHYALQNDPHHPISQALLYAGIVIENQKTYKNKRCSFLLIDRFLYSTLAYNIFYPVLTKRKKFHTDKVCNALIDLYTQCDLHRNVVPHMFIMLESKNAINAKFIPFDYDALLESYAQARPYMEKLYCNLGIKFLQCTLDPQIGADEILKQTLKLVWGNTD